MHRPVAEGLLVFHLQHRRGSQVCPDDKVPDLRAYQCNVAYESEVKSVWTQIIKDFGNIDVLVTAAGICENVAAEDYDYQNWQRMMQVSLDRFWLFAREGGRYMQDACRTGSIILVASVCANKCVRPQKQAAYNASKSAIRMLARTLASEWAPHGIRINSISPGYVKTKMTTGLLNGEGHDLVSTWEKDIPMGRMADPSELRGTIVWMASEASSYLNGSDVVSTRARFLTKN